MFFSNPEKYFMYLDVLNTKEKFQVISNLVDEHDAKTFAKTFAWIKKVLLNFETWNVSYFLPELINFIFKSFLSETNPQKKQNYLNLLFKISNDNENFQTHLQIYQTYSYAQKENIKSQIAETFYDSKKRLYFEYEVIFLLNFGVFDDNILNESVKILNGFYRKKDKPTEQILELERLLAKTLLNFKTPLYAMSVSLFLLQEFTLKKSEFTKIIQASNHDNADYLRTLLFL